MNSAVAIALGAVSLALFAFARTYNGHPTLESEFAGGLLVGLAVGVLFLSTLLAIQVQLGRLP